MKTVKVRGMEIGKGMPKVIVPIVGKTRESIVEQGKLISGIGLDTVEWRVDFYEDAKNVEKLLETLSELRKVLGEIPILFTFRTDREGGEQSITDEEYININTEVAKSGMVDLIDVEIYSGDEVVNKIIENVHGANTYVVASNHEFKYTPEKEEMIKRLKKMEDMNADILKIAVMPTSIYDVNVLLDTTREMSENSERPLITMAMGGKGVISRLSGEVFGSAMTFGAFGKGSAPGQIQVGELKQILKTLHEAL